MLLHLSKQDWTLSFSNSQVIRNIDPLGFDEWLQIVPAANANQDTNTLVALLSLLARRASNALWSAPEFAHASVRDIGIVIGSLKRHGIEPMQAVPSAEKFLLGYSNQCDAVPRDTLHHYTLWNPIDRRRRTYTEDQQERKLQDSVSFVLPYFGTAVAACSSLCELDPRDSQFTSMVGVLSQATRKVIDSIDTVVAEVSPHFFARQLRPYFEEILIGKKNYFGPAASQIPLWLIDVCVWASDRNHPEYQSFLLESLKYNPPSWRALYQKHAGRRSLVSKIESLLSDKDFQNSKQLLRSATSLIELLHFLKIFRGRHMSIAKRAYDPEVALYSHGSGGGPLDLLRRILRLTTDNEHLLRHASAQQKPSTEKALQQATDSGLQPQEKS